MPSRKRNKGQARKARAAIAGGDGASRGIDRQNQQREVGELAVGCRHGFSSPPPQGHVLHKFMDEFNGFYHRILEQYKGNFNVIASAVEAMANALTSNPGFWHDDANRKMAEASILSTGIDALLEGDTKEAIRLVAALFFLERHDPTKSSDDVFYSEETVQHFLKNQDGLTGCERTLTRFYSKRATCSCLVEKYAEVKKLPKSGGCCHCKQRKERSALMLCSACKRVQYCSQACQEADWPTHKNHCEQHRGKL